MTAAVAILAVLLGALGLAAYLLDDLRTLARRARRHGWRVWRE